jgi:hypothetical protein
MTTNGLAALTNDQPVGIKEARTQLFMKRWHEKTKTKKVFLSSVSLLSLAACGSDSDVYVFKADLSVADAIAQFHTLRANGYSIKDTAENIAGAIGADTDVLPDVLLGATQVALNTSDAITVDQSNALAALDNFVGFSGVVTLSDAGTIEIIASRVDTYVLSNAGNTVKISSNNLDVNITGGTDADTIDVAGLTVTGTYALGAGSNKVVLNDGANISGATITATGGSYFVELTDDADATMTIAQNALVTSAAGTNTITLSNAGTATARENVEHYKLADGTNTFNLHSDTESVLGGSGIDVIQTNSVSSLSGVSIDGGSGSDTLAVTGANSNISGAVLTSVENITLATNLNATMTIAQNALVTTAAGTNTITLNDSGTTTGAAQVESYNLANDALNDFTLGAGGQNVTGTGTQNDIVRTGAQTVVSGTINLAGGTEDQLIISSTDTDISTATLTGVEQVNLDQNVNATMTIAQNALVSNAVGTNTITLSNFGTATARATVEHYKLADGTNTFNLHADTASVSGGLGIDVIQTNGVSSLSGVSINGGAGNDTLAVTGANSDISGAVLTSVENITLATNLNATMTIAQNALVTTAAGTNTITLSDVGTATGATQVETYNIQAASTFTLGALSQNVTENVTGQEDASSTLVFGSGAYSGTFTGFGPADVLQVVNGTDISAVTGLDEGILDFQDATATVRLDAAQNGALTILASGADSGTQTIYVDEVDTFTGDVNIETYQITAGSTFTLGSLSQNVTEVGAGNIVQPFEAVSTIVFGSGAYTGAFTTFDATDILEVVNGTNLSGTNLTMGILDFGDAAAAVTMSAAQHAGFTFTELEENQTVVLTTAGTVTSKSGVENYFLSDTGTSTFIQSEFSNAVKVVSGARDDLIITATVDANRAGLTIDLSAGGNDTVRILNSIGVTGIVNGEAGLVTSDFGGFGGNLTGGSTPNNTTDRFNDGSFAMTAADWISVGSPGSSTFVNIHGFTASATDNGRDTVQLQNWTGGYVDEVNRTTTDLLGIASGSVLEINSATFTVSGDQFGNLQSVATMLGSLSNVGDGEYYVIVYNGRDVNADAALFYARATEGDGFDFADSNGGTGGYDTDSLELLAVFHNVGSNGFSSLNFETIPLVA